MAIFVTKRDGSKEPLDLDKVHKVVFWACEGLSGVSPSEVELKSKLTFHDGITTSEITETLIKAAADLISEEAPQYQYVAGRLVNYHLRKSVYGRFQPRRLFDLIKANVEAGFYDPELLTSYTEAEWDEIGDFVNHERDMGLTYVAMEQMRGKYLVQNRASKQILETPQVLYILVASVLFSRYPAETRMKWVRDYYEAISKHEISLPTPIMAGVRTPKRQFSSCTLIECGDSLASINATDNAIVDYVANRAGIGLGAGRIRALGSKVRGGQVTHTGVTPFFKKFAASVNSCNQGGIRKGSATLHYTIWHLQIEDMLVLKNNKGTEENRVRAMDYSVQVSKLFYERLIQGGDITLFSPNDVPEVYDAFYVDNDKFKALYEAAEKDPTIRKKVVKAVDLFTSLMQERKDTGRIYIQNVDNCNSHGSFIPELAAIRMSNLCQEITQATVPMATFRTENVTIPAAALPSFMLDAAKEDKTVKVTGTRHGYRSSGNVLNVLARMAPTSSRHSEAVEFDPATVESMPPIAICPEPVPMVDVETTEDMSRIALCTLSAVNWGVVKSPKDFARICPLAVRGLDELLSYQGYPVLAARKHTEEYRPLGIGIINFAYFLAKNNAKYSDGSGLAITDEYAEAWSYYLIKASMDLAREKGACKLSSHTKYAKGIVPIDTRKRDIDELVPHVERLDWAGLREDLKTHGIRNATLMALMPAETSAQIANATNGIEPPRNLISVKVSKEGVLKQVVPEIRKLKNKYELLWDQKSPVGYLQLCAVLQKYIDQAISVNTSYNPAFYEDEKVPMSDLLKHMLLHYKWGGKTAYYCQTNDGQGEIDVDKLAASTVTGYMSATEASDTFEGSGTVDDDDDCDACKI